MPFLYYQVSNSLYDVQSRWHNIVIPDLYVREDSKSVDLLQPFTNNYKHSTMMRGGSYIFFALEPNTNFEVRIQARNTYGWGRFSEIFLFSTNSAGINISKSEKNRIYSFEGDIPKELPVEIQSNEILGI